MNSIVEETKNSVSRECLQESDKPLAAGNCRLHLTDTQAPRLIIHFDKPGAPLGERDTKPDFLFLSDKGRKDKNGKASQGLLVPIEISSGKSKSANHITEQLQAGVDWFSESFPNQSQLEMIPVYCGRINNHAKKAFDKPNYRVTYRGQNRRPRLRQCGSKLTDALKATES